MNIDIINLKKRILYRSQYRGSKEMDKLLYSFVSENIDKISVSKLFSLEKFLEIDDEKLYKFYNNLNNKIEFEDTFILDLFKNLNLIKKVSGGETGIRTGRVAPLPVFKTGAFNRSAISPRARFYKYNFKFNKKIIYSIYFLCKLLADDFEKS